MDVDASVHARLYRHPEGTSQMRVRRCGHSEQAVSARKRALATVFACHPVAWGRELQAGTCMDELVQRGDGARHRRRNELVHGHAPPAIGMHA